MLNRSYISVSPLFCLTSAFSLLILPMQWVLGWMLAALVHELFHLIMLKIFGIKVYAIRVSGVGTVIRSDSMLPIQEFLCAISGPVGALILLLFIRIYPQVAVSAMVQSAYNFLPVYPFDGGRALKSFLLCIFEEARADKIARFIALAFALLFAATVIFLSFRYKLGIIPGVFLVIPIALVYFKNSLQTSKNNCTMDRYVSE